MLRQEASSGYFMEVNTVILKIGNFQGHLVDQIQEVRILSRSFCQQPNLPSPVCNSNPIPQCATVEALFSSVQQQSSSLKCNRNPSTGRLRLENFAFKATSSFILRPCHRLRQEESALCLLACLKQGLSMYPRTTQNFRSPCLCCDFKCEPPYPVGGKRIFMTSPMLVKCFPKTLRSSGLGQ